MFAIKAELKKRPFLMIGILFTMTLVYITSIVRTLEMYRLLVTYRPYASDDGDSFDFAFFFNSLWLVLITMSTVGYGDAYPRTHAGRFFIIFACITGMLIVSLMVVSLTNLIEFTPEEQKVE